MAHAPLKRDIHGTAALDLKSPIAKMFALEWSLG